MENNTSQTKIAMKYGAIYGFSSIAVFLLFYVLGVDLQSKLPSFASYILLITFIIFGVKYYRDEVLGGYISYGKSLGTGVLISIFGGLISGFFTFLFFKFISPEMIQQILDQAQKKFAEQGMSDEQIEMAMNWSAKFMTPMGLLISSIIGSAFLGFIFSLLISIFMRKEQNPFNSNQG